MSWINATRVNVQRKIGLGDAWVEWGTVGTLALVRCRNEGKERYKLCRIRAFEKATGCLKRLLVCVLKTNSVS